MSHTSPRLSLDTTRPNEGWKFPHSAKLLLRLPPQVSKPARRSPRLNAASWIQAGHPVCAEVVRQIKVPVKPSFLLHPTRRVVQAHACRDALFTVECINHPSSWCANTDK